MLIGSIVKAKCVSLGIEPNITIDVPTRLSLSIEATEEDFREAVLPIESWEVFLISPWVEANKISVEMIPNQPSLPRDPLAEIDTLKARVKKLEKK